MSRPVGVGAPWASRARLTREVGQRNVVAEDDVGVAVLADESRGSVGTPGEHRDLASEDTRLCAASDWRSRQLCDVGRGPDLPFPLRTNVLPDAGQQEDGGVQDELCVLGDERELSAPRPCTADAARGAACQFRCSGGLPGPRRRVQAVRRAAERRGTPCPRGNEVPGRRGRAGG